VAVIASQFYPELAERLLAGCRGALRELGCATLDEYAVPGAFELPLAAQAAARSGRYDTVVALGVVIRGETSHYDHVCRAATDGLLQVGLETGVPVACGVLTTEDHAQALARAAQPGEPGMNKGAEAARVAVEMAEELQRIRKGGV
jgi:6,7-dimethyl-8-ribityllumazine synthase